jgi:hypothetical protein
MLHRRRQAPITYFVFDMLAIHGEPTLRLPYRERRRRLEQLDLNGRTWQTTHVFSEFSDGEPCSTRFGGTGSRASSRSGLRSRTSLVSAVGEDEEPALLALPARVAAVRRSRIRTPS